MAKVKMKNPVTGALFEVDERKIDRYKKLGWTTSNSTETKPKTTQPKNVSNKKINTGIQGLIDSNRKMSSTDVANMFNYFYNRKPSAAEKSYWEGKQTSNLNSSMESHRAQFGDSKYNKDTGNSQNQSTGSRKATLTSSDGKHKVEVIIGSEEASRLQEAGWEIGDDGISTMSEADALAGINKDEADSGYGDYLGELVSSGEISQNEADMLQGAYDKVNINEQDSEEDLTAQASKALDRARDEQKPYYEDLQNRDMEDLKNGYDDIRNESTRFQQKEEKSYKEKLASTKQSLRARGLTFSGSSRRVLGKEGALNDKNIEGELPQSRRYNWEDARAGWQERGRDLGTAAERRYGSDALYNQRDYLNPEGLPDPYKNGPDYSGRKTAPIYLPHKKDAKYGYVDSDHADTEREKENQARLRAEQIQRTNQYN